MCVDQVYQACLVVFVGYKTLANLVILEFYINLGMSWLSHYHIILDCYIKTVP